MKPETGTKPWIVVLSAFFNIFLTSVAYSTGVIYVALLEKYGESITTTTWVGALFHSVFCLAGPIGGFLSNRFSCRTCVVVGSWLSLVGFGLSGISPNLYVLFLTYGIIAGTGQSMSFTGSLIMVGYYFTRYRTLASGIAFSGTGLGMVIFPPLIQFLLSVYGLKGTFMILGAKCFHSCIFGLLLRPSSLEIERKLKDVNKKSLTSKQCCNNLEHFQLFKSVGFLWFCISILLISSGLNTCVLYLPKYFSETGSSKLQSSFLMSVFGLGNVLSRILTGIAAVEGGLDGKMIYFGSYGIVSLLTFFLPLYGQTYTGQAIYSLFLGLYTGGTWTLLSQISVDLTSIHNLASAIGVELFTAGVGFLIGPVFGSILLNSFDFEGVLVYVGEPNNWRNQEDCVVMKSNGDWNDISCNRHFKGIVCQIDVPVKDVAYRKQATQSSNYHWYHYQAKNALNDRLSMGSCTLTKYETDPWWKVDLQSVYEIKKVVLVNRRECCGRRLKNIVVTVGVTEDKMEQCARYDEGIELQCYSPEYGKYVKVQLEGKDYLILCQVKVYAYT